MQIVMVEFKEKTFFLDKSNLPLLVEFVNTFKAKMKLINFNQEKIISLDKFVKKLYNLGFEPKIQKLVKKPKMKTNSQINKEINEVKTFILLNKCNVGLLELKQNFINLDYSDSFYLKLMFQCDKIMQKQKDFMKYFK